MKRILYVEDDMIISSGLLYALDQEGYAVVHCKSVKEAVSILEHQQFDLALLDMQLPDGTWAKLAAHKNGWVYLVQMRSREFAVLQSIGMTHDGLKRMLNLESIMCSTKSLIIGLPLALVLTYLINKPIRTMFPVPYQFPWFTVICCIVVVFIITWSTMWYSSKQLYKKNVIETIRLES